MTAFKAVKYLADIGRIVAVSCSAGSDDLLTKRRGAPGAVTLCHVYRVISHFQNFCDDYHSCWSPVAYTYLLLIY